MSDSSEWWDTYSNVVSLGRWLVDEQCYDAGDLQYYYSKPWKYGHEWERMSGAAAVAVGK